VKLVHPADSASLSAVHRDVKTSTQHNIQ